MSNEKVSLQELAQIEPLETEYVGLVISPRSVQEYVVKLILASSSMIEAKDIFSVRTLVGKKGDVEIILQLKEKALKRRSGQQQQQTGGNNWLDGIDSDDSNGKYNKDILNAFKGVLFDSPNAMRYVKKVYKQEKLVEFRLSEYAVMAAIANVAYDDEFLKVLPFDMSNYGKKRKHDNDRTCGINLRYSTPATYARLHDGASNEFSKQYVMNYVWND